MSPLRESLIETANPLGLDGIEYVEYATSAPQATGHVLELMGFRPIARHRSREVMLYRQGAMNLIVNAHPGPGGGGSAPTDRPRIAALALRVGNARSAFEQVLERGAWEIPMRAEVMELNIPGIQGPAGARIYFVDRYREFSIYDVDFIPIPTVEPRVPAIGGMGYFGLVQYIGRDRTEDWCEFWRHLFAFTVLPEGERYGILPKGTLLKSPCGTFMIQLVEPEMKALVSDEEELFHRIGFGTPDVPGTVAELRRRGVEFVESAQTHTGARGALTRHYLHSLLFELVQVAGVPA
jgi:4-hydroxyphenylpyruvate dioxygenase